jgi:hypothetical protein
VRDNANIPDSSRGSWNKAGPLSSLSKKICDQRLYQQSLPFTPNANIALNRKVHPSNKKSTSIQVPNLVAHYKIHEDVHRRAQRLAQ